MTETIEKLAHSSVLTLVGRAAIGVLVIFAGMMLRELWSMRDEMITFKSQFAVMTVQFNAQQAMIQQTFVDRYTNSDALRDVRFLQVQIDNIARRQDAIERAPSPRAQARPK